MALIIEDGTIVAGANSFVTDAEFTAFADLRNVELPTDLADREALLIKAMDYLLSVENQMQGERVDAGQTLPYPRTNVYAFNFAIPSDSIPSGIKSAQMQAGISASTFDLLPSGQINNVASEKVGQLERSYFNGGSYTTAQTKAIDAFLKPFLKMGGMLSTLRI